jgi:hypothetical protein
MKHLPASLTALNICMNSHLTDAGLQTLVTAVPHLTELNVGFCFRITDAGRFL